MHEVMAALEMMDEAPCRLQPMSHLLISSAKTDSYQAFHHSQQAFISELAVNLLIATATKLLPTTLSLKALIFYHCCFKFSLSFLSKH